MLILYIGNERLTFGIFLTLSFALVLNRQGSSGLVSRNNKTVIRYVTKFIIPQTPHIPLREFTSS
jgi:hypothetical protein